MAFFDELKDRAMDLGRAGVAKSKQIVEIAKLNLANAAEEDAMKKAYVEIGKLYYAERGMAPDGAYVALCEKITAAKQRIEGMMDKVVEGFEKQLDKLFSSDAMDIAADVQVLENMLKKDGLSGDNMKLD